MLLVPDDALREVQAVLLQERRIVAEVGVAAPDVEPAPRLQHAGHVAEPGVEQAVELLVRSRSRWPAAGPWPAASSASASTFRDGGQGRACW